MKSRKCVFRFCYRTFPLPLTTEKATAKNTIDWPNFWMTWVLVPFWTRFEHKKYTLKWEKKQASTWADMLAICLQSELLKYLFPQPGEEGQISEKITAFLWLHISEKKKNTDINQTVQLSGFLVSKETVVLRRWERKIKNWFY